MRRTSMKALAALLLLAAIFVPSHQGFGGDNSHWGANYFPNVELVTQDRKTVHFYDDLLKGKIVVIDLIYTHCKDMCPLETARLAQVQKMLGDRVGKDIFFYSISIDPKEDTPEVMKAYAEKFHAGPGWLFLTGKKDDIDLISKKLGLYTEPSRAGRDGHAPNILIGNEASGQWMRNSATDNPRFLATVIGDWLNSWKNAKAAKSNEPAPKMKLDEGRYLFATQCAACHSIGHGDKVGPDLLGVTTIRDRAWLFRFIGVPDKVLAEKDPIATALFNKYQVQMPNLRLEPAEVQEILTFLESQSSAARAGAAGQDAPNAQSTRIMPHGSGAH